MTENFPELKCRVSDYMYAAKAVLMRKLLALKILIRKQKK